MRCVCARRGTRVAVCTPGRWPGSRVCVWCEMSANVVVVQFIHCWLRITCGRPAERLHSNHCTRHDGQTNGTSTLSHTPPLIAVDHPNRQCKAIRPPLAMKWHLPFSTTGKNGFASKLVSTQSSCHFLRGLPGAWQRAHWWWHARSQSLVSTCGPEASSTQPHQSSLRQPQAHISSTTTREKQPPPHSITCVPSTASSSAHDQKGVMLLAESHASAVLAKPTP
jgi:hypothetical protein